MPIEIRELVIRVAVEDQNRSKAAPQLSANELNALKNKIVKECMETILRKIGQLTDR